MRTGAIFARGSCRALRWMALAGMAFALGSAQAAAQVTLVRPPTSFTEGVATEIRVRFMGTVPVGGTAISTVNFTVTAAGATLSNNGVVQFTLAGNASTTAAAPFDLTRMISVTPAQDADAEDGTLTVSFALVDTGPARQADGIARLAAPNTLSALPVVDDDPQNFALQLRTLANNLEEAKPVEYRIVADPQIVAVTEMVELELLNKNYTITGDVVSGTGANGVATVEFNSSRTTEAVIMYTAPKDADSDDQTVVLNAYWGSGSSRRSISHSVTLKDPDAPTTTPSALTFTPATQPDIMSGVVAGTAITPMQLPTVTAGGTPPYMYMATGLPAGLMVASATGMLTGTPTAAGTMMVTYTAMDSSSPALSGSLMFSITVAAAGTPPTTLATPTGFTATAGNAQVALAWTAVTGATSYEYSANLGPWTSAGTGPSFVVVGLVNGTAYSIRLRAVNAAGQSVPTAAKVATPTATPPPTTLATPKGFKATAGNAQVTLAWTAVAGATGYQYSSNLGSWTSAGTGTSFVVVGLANGTAYSFRLRAINEVAQSLPTDAVTATPTAIMTPTSATDGIITAIRVGTETTAPERTIGGVARVHVTEGTTTDVNVTVEWTHAQVTALWEGHTTASPPEPAMVQVVVAPATDTAGAAWLSLAESGADAILQTATVSIAIPAKPKPTEEPNAVNRFRPKTGKTVLSIAEDVDAEDEGFRVDVVPGTGVFVSTSESRGRTTTDRLNVIVDDETQGIKLSRDPASTAAIFEGDTVPLKAVAAPARVNLPLKVRYSVTDLDGVAVSSRLYTLDGGTGEIPVGTGAAAKDTVKFSTPKNDGNREDNEFTIHADVQSFDLGSGAFDDIAESTVDITVLDVHRLPVVSISPMEDTVKEGDTVELELTLDRNPPRDRSRRIGGEKKDVTSEAVTVMLSAGAGSTAGMDDYMLPAAVTFEKHNGKAPWEQTAMVDVMVRADDELDAGEVLMLDAMVAGTVAANGAEKSSQAGLAMLTIEEGTGKLVWALEESVVMKAVYDAIEAGAGEDMIVTEGETIELEGNDVFGSAEGVSVSYSSDSSDDDVASDSVSGGMITVTAMGEGMAEITVTAHASSPSGVKIMDQTDPREASIKFPVEVGLEALSIMLSGPDEMNLVEGGMGGMVTAMANREVTEAVTITLMRDRAMSTAGDDDYMAEAITIEAGMMSGTTMVMAVEDDMMENMDNMPEELVLYGMAADNAGEVTGEVKFYLWDAAVPALPLIAQLLLAAFLAIGGFRRYRRR